jgi:hypothetical protein
LPLFFKEGNLVPALLAHGLFAIELRRLQQRRVAYAEKQSVISNKVPVAVRAPIEGSAKGSSPLFAFCRCVFS